MSRINPDVVYYVEKYGRFVDHRLINYSCGEGEYSVDELERFIKEHFDDGRRLYRYEDTDDYKEAVAYRDAVRKIVYEMTE